jgi:SAM-dependent methyltransferase
MTDHQQYLEYLSGRSALGASYRRHWLYPHLARRLRGRCLDIGCGIGDMLLFRAQTVGVDVNPGAVQMCRTRGAEAHVMEPDRLPFDSSAFDSALMDNVLEHIVEPRPLLLEAHRVLRPGGQLLVGVPGHCGWASDPDHKVFYDEHSLCDCVSTVGFRKLECFHTPLWRSPFMDRHLRQYCVYTLFAKA